MASRDEETLEAELKGKTLLVYLYLLRSRKNTVGVREIQRALGFRKGEFRLTPSSHKRI